MAQKYLTLRGTPHRAWPSDAIPPTPTLSDTDYIGGTPLTYARRTGLTAVYLWTLLFADSADVELVTRVRRLRKNDSQGVTSDISGPGLIVRSPFDTPSRGYKLMLGSIPDNYRSVAIYRRGNVSSGQLTYNNILPALESPNDSIGAAVWMRFRVSSGSLQGKCWWDGDPEPELWQLTATNFEFATGGAGLVLMGSNELAQFDFLGIGTDGDTAPTTPVMSDDDDAVIAGIITDGNGDPASRHVLVIDRELREIVSSAVSDPDTGEYAVHVNGAGEYTRVVLADDDAEGVVYNDIVDRIIVP